MSSRGEEIFNEIQRQGISQGRIRFFLANLSESEKKAYRDYKNREQQKAYREKNKEKANERARIGMEKVRRQRKIVQVEKEMEYVQQQTAKGILSNAMTNRKARMELKNLKEAKAGKMKAEEDAKGVIAGAVRGYKARKAFSKEQDRQIEALQNLIDINKTEIARTTLSNAVAGMKARKELKSLKQPKQPKTEDKVTKGITRFQAVVRGADFRSYTLPNIMENQYINRALERIEKKVASRKISGAVAGMKARKELKSLKQAKTAPKKQSYLDTLMSS